MQPRVKLLKSWKSKYGKLKPVGTIMQLTPMKASELIRNKIAEKYEGEYPPNRKIKINLSQLNSK